MREKILVVDDDALTADLVSELLEDAGYDVCVARSGEDALALLRTTELPDAAVIDQHLPGLGGIDLIRAMRADHRLDRIGLVAVSADADARAAVRRLGVLTLAKPLDVFDLIHAVRRVVGEATDLELQAPAAGARAEAPGRQRIFST